MTSALRSNNFKHISTESFVPGVHGIIAYRWIIIIFASVFILSLDVNSRNDEKFKQLHLWPIRKSKSLLAIPRLRNPNHELWTLGWESLKDQGDLRIYSSDVASYYHCEEALIVRFRYSAMVYWGGRGVRHSS